MNLNKAFVLGNVTRDPEVRALPSGQQVTNFGVATNRYYTDSTGQKKEDVEFHNIVCFGKLADISSRYLAKGSLVLIEGRIKTHNWQDASGQKHYKTEIIADGLQLGPRGLGQPRPSQSSLQSVGTEPQQIKQDEIPVIEENYAPPAANLASNDNKGQTLYQGDASEEISVENIPF